MSASKDSHRRCKDSGWNSSRRPRRKVACRVVGALYQSSTLHRLFDSHIDGADDGASFHFLTRESFFFAARKDAWRLMT